MTSSDTPKSRPRNGRLPGALGDYHLLYPLARDTLGTLFLARRDRGPDVALRLLPEALAQHARHRRRMLRIVGIARRLADPGVLRPIGLGEDLGRIYYIREHAPDSLPLSALLRDWGALTEVQALTVAVQVCGSLEALHRRLLWNPGLCPLTLRVGLDGTVRVAELGLADHRRHGVGGGSAAYLPPEVVRGGAFDDAGDLYQLGTLLWHLLAGRPPFAAPSTRQILRAHLRHRPRPPVCPARHLHPATAALIARLLDKRPARRAASARSLSAELEHRLRLAMDVGRGRPLWRRVEASLAVRCPRRVG